MLSTAWRLTPEKILTREDVSAILVAAEAQSYRDYVFFATAANTGLRLCEVIHLKRTDLHNGQLEITRRKKKKLRPELLDLPHGLYEVVEDWANHNGSGWLFPGRQAPCMIRHLNGTTTQVCEGKHVSRRDMQRRWSLCCKAAGLDMRGRGIHTLRHYAISEFYDTHRDLRAAQLFAGHSSPAITTVYAHVRDMKDKIQAMEVTL